MRRTSDCARSGTDEFSGNAVVDGDESSPSTWANNSKYG